MQSDFVLRNWIQKHSLEREKIKATLWQNLQFWFRNGQKLCVRWSFLYLVLFFPMTTKKFCQERKMLLSSNIRLLVFFLWSNVSGLPCLNILVKKLCFFFTNYATCPLLSLFCPWLSLVCPCLLLVSPRMSLVILIPPCLVWYVACAYFPSLIWVPTNYSYGYDSSCLTFYKQYITGTN